MTKQIMPGKNKMTHHTLQVVMTTDCVTPVLVDSLREHWNKYGVTEHVEYYTPEELVSV